MNEWMNKEERKKERIKRKKERKNVLVYVWSLVTIDDWSLSEWPNNSPIKHNVEHVGSSDTCMIDERAYG